MFRNITKRGLLHASDQCVTLGCVLCDVKIPRGDYTLKAVIYFTGIHRHNFLRGGPQHSYHTRRTPEVGSIFVTMHTAPLLE